jgi:preprotein translocase subunit Sec61beta
MSTKKSSGSGLMSSAGLMRYYDADKKAIHVSPKTVMVTGATIGFIVLLLNAYFGFWPIS